MPDLTLDEIYGRPGVRYWLNPHAPQCVVDMTEALGEPDEVLPDRMVWNSVAGFVRVEVVAERYNFMHTVKVLPVSAEKKAEMEQIPIFSFEGNDFIVSYDSANLDANAIAHKYGEDMFVGIEDPTPAKLQVEIDAGVEFPTWYTPLSEIG